MSLATFTFVHVLISLVAIASGLVVVFGLMGRKPFDSWTALFLTTTVLTSITGFMFPFEHVTPGIKVGIISLVVLAIAIGARYAFHMTGAWRSVYTVGATLALYLNVFVLVGQLFEKVPALHQLAPTGSEAPFLVAQLVVLAGFLVLGTLATKRFRPSAVSKARSASAVGSLRYTNAVAQVPCRWIGLLALAAAVPVAGLADLDQTTTLPSSTTLSLDTGATAASGGDILWDGSAITPQGKARAYNVGNLGATAFGIYLKANYVSFSILATSAPIPASTLVVGDVFAVFTNGGNVAGVLVTANSGGSITLQSKTFITVVPTGPNITAIQNNSSRIAAGFPNYGIAPSSIFVVVGTGLADPGEPVLQSSAAPGIPLTLNGASITVVVKGVTVHPALYYTSPTQLAAVLPAATPIGTGTLTVGYKGATSNAATIQVVPAALGINVYNTNTAVATDGTTGALLTYTNSGMPGETLVLWTSGLGADPADSDSIFSSTPHQVNTPLQVYLGGIAAKILYQGSSGYPGVTQINFVLPASAPNGCWISLAAVAGGVVSNIATLPINAGGGACVDDLTGLKGNQIAPSGGRTLRTGLVALVQTNSPAKGGTRTITSSADAAFEKYTGIYTPSQSLSPGGCIVNNLTPVPIGSITGLDAGKITLTGPAGLNVTLANQLGIKGAFYALLTSSAIPISGGTFTFQGSGGVDVGSFTSTITFTNPLLTWTNLSVAVTIDRTKDLTVTWTGGNPGSYMFISGDSVTPPPQVIGGFTCLAKADDGQFKIPSYILSALPAGNGGAAIQNAIFQPLSASGLDIGLADGAITYSVASKYQ